MMERKRLVFEILSVWRTWFNA